MVWHTLLELAVVITLMGIVAALAQPKMDAYMRRNKTERALDRLTSDLLMTRMQAVRSGDRTVLEPNMCFHCIPGIWQDNWGMEISAAFVVTAMGAERLCTLPEELVVKP